jgi:hypothetical protein
MWYKHTIQAKEWSKFEEEMTEHMSLSLVATSQTLQKIQISSYVVKQSFTEPVREHTPR